MDEDGPIPAFPALIRDRLGIELPAIQAPSLERAWRAARAAFGAGVDPVAALAARSWRAQPWQQVVDAVTVGETSFFRHPAWLERLQEQALAPLVAARRREGRRRLRIWSAGCATGEEAYTLAILLCGLLPDRAGWEVAVLGTDISLAKLAAARAAAYPAWPLRAVTPSVLAGCFTEAGGGRHRVAPEVAELVRFQPFNLADPEEDAGTPDPGRFDLIVCRNVLMYLAPPVQRAAVAYLRGRLVGGGWLAVSPAEAVAEWFRPLVPVNSPEAIFFHDRPLHDRPVRDSRAAAGAVPAVAASPALRVAKRHTAEPPVPAMRLAARRPRRVRAYPRTLRRAWRLADQGRLDAARRLCEAVVRRCGITHDSGLLLAAVHAERGSASEALWAARQALYLRPGSAAAQYQVALALARLDRTEQARRGMAAVLDLLPSEAASGEHEQALRHAARAYLDTQTGLDMQTRLDTQTGHGKARDGAA